MKLRKRLVIITSAYSLMLIYWLALNLTHHTSSTSNYYFGLFEGLEPLLLGALGIVTSKLWGGRQSELGKSLFYISLGVMSWGIGSVIWSWYTIRQISAVPYPSLADLGFLAAIPFWAAGIVKLSKTTGVMLGLKRPKRRLAAIVVPVIVLAISYYLLVSVAREGSLVSSGSTSHLLKVILDISYPTGDVIILSLALLVFGLSSGFLGGRFRRPIYILLGGFAIQYFADFGFSFTTTNGTYYNGNWCDLLFVTALTVIALGINLITPPHLAVKETAAPQPEPAGEPPVSTTNNIPNNIPVEQPPDINLNQPVQK